MKYLRRVILLLSMFLIKEKSKGYTTFNRDEGKSFGELSKMTDEEIMEYYESQEGTFLKHIYDVTASNAEQFPDETQYKELAEALKPYGDGKGQVTNGWISG